MGITNDLFPHEPYGGISEAQMRECDQLKDPEDLVDPRTGKRAIDNFESFMRFLAPVAAGRSPTRCGRASRYSARSDARSCHVPALTTGAMHHRR